MMNEKDALQVMDELEKNGVDMKEELRGAAKELQHHRRFGFGRTRLVLQRRVSAGT